MSLTQEEQEHYRNCLEVYAELNSDSFIGLRKMLLKLRDRCIDRLATLEDKALTREQGKLQQLNEILNKKDCILGEIENIAENLEE